MVFRSTQPSSDEQEWNQLKGMLEGSLQHTCYTFPQPQNRSLKAADTQKCQSILYNAVSII